MIERIVDTITGDISEIPYTTAQIADSEKMQKIAEEEIALLEQKKSAKKAIWEKLGLTDEEIKLLSL